MRMVSTFSAKCPKCHQSTTLPASWLNTKVGFWLADLYMTAWWKQHRHVGEDR